MRAHIYKIVFAFISLHFFFTAKAQNDVDAILNQLGLNQALYPSEDILQTKSLVLFSVPKDDNSTEWQEILDEMQGFFAEVGLDAVAYLQADRYDILQNIPQPFPEFTFKRGIQNLVIFSAESVDGPFFFAITDFNNEETFYNRGAPAFARLSNELSGVWQELNTYFRTDQFRRTNLLVNENPEFFNPILETGPIGRTVPPQVSEFKIALKPVSLTKYDDLPIFKTQYHNLFRRDSLTQVVSEQNQLLKALSVDSTNTMALVPLDANDATLRRDGFIYELKVVKAREDLVYEWISFPDRPKAKQRTVYKFFLDDLRTNTIFIGKKWDASPSWFEALNTFVEQIKEAAASAGN